MGMHRVQGAAQPGPVQGAARPRTCEGPRWVLVPGPGSIADARACMVT